MGCEEPIACARIGRPTNSQAEANQTKQGGKFECFFFFLLSLLVVVGANFLFVRPFSLCVQRPTTCMCVRVE